MQFLKTAGKPDKLKNRGGTISFPALQIYRRPDHKYHEKRRNMKRVMEYRRLRSGMREQLRFERKFNYGWGGSVLVGGLTLILLVPLVLLLFPFLPFIIIIALLYVVANTVFRNSPTSL